MNESIDGDWHDIAQGRGEWSHVLLADGNIGIGGDPLRLLRRARQLLHPHGVADVDARGSWVVQEYRRRGTRHTVGSGSPGAHVGSDAIAALAESAGFLLARAVHICDQFVAVLQVD